MQSNQFHTVYGNFPASLNISNLSDICVPKSGVQTGPFGSQLHQKDYVEKGVPIITVEHLGDNKIVHIDTPFVSDDDYNRLIKYNLKKGDIVFSRVGSVDRRALVSENEDGWLFSGRCLRVRPNNEIIDSSYLSYFFGLHVFKKYVRSIAVGATMPSINTKILSDLPVVYPPLLTQKKIAHILSTLDDKIELNRKMNQTLEMMAQALFKSWFVDFDPVHVNVNAAGREDALGYKATATSDAELEKAAAVLGISKEVLDLFPSELEESEMGMIPKGWEVKSIYDVANIVYGAPFSSKQFNDTQTGKPLIRIRDLKTFNSQHWTEEEHAKGTLITAGDLLIGMDAEFTPTIWQGIDGWLNQRVLKVVPLNGTYTAYHYFSLKPKMQFFEKANVGTTVIHLGKKDIDTIDVLVPSKELLGYSALIMEPLFKQLVQNSIHNRSLQKTRDTLLPKLLSGELDVSEIKLEGL